MSAKPTPADVKQALAAHEPEVIAPLWEQVSIAKPRLMRAIPTGTMTWEYALAALAQETKANPALAECEPASVIGAWAQTLQLGLPLGPLGLAYLVPFKRECVCIIGYQGYIELAYRSGLVKAVNARLVYEHEHFRELAGTSNRIEHEILPPREDSQIVAAYAVADLKAGGKSWKVIREPDWTKARAASPLGSKGKGLWAEHFPEAVLKTAVRRAAKLWPKSPAMMQAETVDELPAEPYEAVPDDDE